MVLPCSLFLPETEMPEKHECQKIFLKGLNFITIPDNSDFSLMDRLLQTLALKSLFELSRPLRSKKIESFKN